MSHMDQPVEWVDALGALIVMGKRYGYAAGASGRTHTVVGTAVKLTPTGKVTLNNLTIKDYLWGKPCTSGGTPAQSVSIGAFKVFPVVEATDV